MAKKKTHEEFVEQLQIINPQIKILGLYKNARTPILCECQKCGYQWPGIPNNLLRKEGCGRCAGHIKKTTEEFIEEVRRVNPFVKVLGEYTNNKTPIACECVRCGHQWNPWPSSLLRGHGCDECAKKSASKSRRKSNDAFIKELSIKNPGVKPMENYKGSSVPIRCVCICGNENWYVSPRNLLRGSLCKKCAIKNSSVAQQKTHEKFVAECAEKNPSIEILGVYSGADRHIEVKCKRCGNIWSPFASAVLKGAGCPKCKKQLQTSFAEQAIYFYIKKHYPKSINSFKNGFGRSELDIFIPDIRVGIECDGRNWHKGKAQSEEKKYNTCQKLNIHLIRVRERRIKATGDICDHIIYSEYDDTKSYSSLDSCIQRLFDYLSLSEDIDCKRDRIEIQSQYLKLIEEKSLGRLFPGLIPEWHQPSNGSITPFMIKPKSNVSFYWKCPDCGVIYEATPASRTNGTGCAICAGVKTLTQAEFLKRVHKNHPTIIVLGEYKNAKTRVKCKCSVCGTIWNPIPQAVTTGVGCKKCWEKRMAEQKRKPEALFIEQIKSKHPNITVLGKYINSNGRVPCRCNVCGHEWSPVAQSLMSGFGCGNCAPTKARKVVCIETGESYASIHHAAKTTGICRATISRCCNGKGKTAGGFRWEFVKER